MEMLKRALIIIGLVQMSMLGFASAYQTLGDKAIFDYNEPISISTGSEKIALYYNQLGTLKSLYKVKILEVGDDGKFVKVNTDFDKSPRMYQQKDLYSVSKNVCLQNQDKLIVCVGSYLRLNGNRVMVQGISIVPIVGFFSEQTMVRNVVVQSVGPYGATARAMAVDANILEKN